MRDSRRTSPVQRFIIGKLARAFRLASIMVLVSLATFGALVEGYKLLF
jgi:hypothetical protein